MTNARQPVTAEITEAFLALMVEKPFIDITVTDIVRKAGVARASFYRNFSSTSEILENVLNNVTEQFREYVLPVVTGNDQRKWREFLFRHIYFISDRQQKIISRRSSAADPQIYRYCYPKCQIFPMSSPGSRYIKTSGKNTAYHQDWP